jgi:hypothetical protein
MRSKVEVCTLTSETAAASCTLSLKYVHCLKAVILAEDGHIENLIC